MVITWLLLETDIRLSERKWQQLKSLFKDRSGGGATGLLRPRRRSGAAACDWSEVAESGVLRGSGWGCDWLEASEGNVAAGFLAGMWVRIHFAIRDRH